MKKSISLVLLISLFMAGCARKEIKNEENKAVLVGTTQAELKPYIPTLNYSGNVLPNKEANLGATLPGKVEKMNIKLGETVKKGCLLAELSGEMLTQAVVENDALQKDFDRISRLKEKGSVSQMEYDHLKARLDASMAKVEMMKKNTQVIAPFNGTVVDIFVHEGENFSLLPSIDAQNLSVNPGILKLMQLNPVKVTFEVNEKELSWIKTGQIAFIRVDALPEKTFEGRISYIRPVLSAVSRTATIEVEVNNPANALKPGMYANLEIKLPPANGIFIPVSCIYRKPGTSNDYVFMVIDGKAKSQAVRQLQTMKDLVLVDGLANGATVVSVGKAKLSDGSVVEIQKK